MKIYHFALVIYDKINDVYDDVFVASRFCFVCVCGDVRK